MFFFKDMFIVFFFNLITLDEHEWKYYDSGRFFRLVDLCIYISPNNQNVAHV